MSQRRVVVTGVGCISALGTNINATWESACHTSSQVPAKPIYKFSNADQEILNYGLVVDNIPETEFLTVKKMKNLERLVSLALYATDQAYKDARIENDEYQSRWGVTIGTGYGAVTSIEDCFKQYFLENKRLSPNTIPKIMANAAAGIIAAQYKLRGPNFTVSTACSSANHSVGEAYLKVKDGYADLMLTGGSDVPFSEAVMAAWTSMRVLASSDTASEPPVCRPFSKDRTGFLISEGAVILILEELNHALKRGAPIHGEVIGYVPSCDAGHITHPDVNSIEDTMGLAVQYAGLKKEDITYINAHGTGTSINDEVETNAIKQCFKDHAYKLAVTSTKSHHGHLMGATGSMEMLLTLFSMKNGMLLPTANYREKDPACDLDYVTEGVRQADIKYALSNSFGFGGGNAVLVLKRWDGI